MQSSLQNERKLKKTVPESYGPFKNKSENSLEFETVSLCWIFM